LEEEAAPAEPVEAPAPEGAEARREDGAEEGAAEAAAPERIEEPADGKEE
jgi:hypothetical protein